MFPPTGLQEKEIKKGSGFGRIIIVNDKLRAQPQQ